LVIDEAHHATAKTYREIIEIVNKKTRKSKILGLTATPFRTAEKERGLLKKVFVDDIIYEVSLRTLISRGILARPIFEKIQTHIPIGKLNGEDLKSIEIFNSIPPKIASHIATNKIRNNRIVESYVKNKEEYGKLLV
ncbi:helicase, partial [Butyricicoccus sp. 1XD8-22]